MKPADAIRAVAVIGNGRMGTGISQVFASRGKEVRLVGRNSKSLAKALGVIEANLAEFVARQLMKEEEAAAALSRIPPMNGWMLPRAA